jgi:hypothetical protein
MVKNKSFFSVVKKYNRLMKGAVEGPDCINPAICNGDCCGIQIDVPKVLANKYIERNYASKKDFIRSNIYSFKIRFDLKSCKCVLFDSKLNGCSVHKTGIKPPECWIYPTGLTKNEKQEYKCKNAKGWRIVDSKKLKEAKMLFEHYKFLCFLEARKEMKNIRKRILNSKEKNLNEQLQTYKPFKLAGFKDIWDKIVPLPAEGYSLYLKRFCEKYNPTCKYLPEDFLNCDHICQPIAQELITFLERNLYVYCRKEGVDPSGKYPFYKLFSFIGI